MIAELALLLAEFPGAANRSRCFTHILNLAARSVLRQFDAPKGKVGAAASEAAQELDRLLADLESDELRARVSDDMGAILSDPAAGHADDGEPIEDDDVEGWVDEMDNLSEEEQDDIEADAIPVRLMLVKVSFYPAEHINDNTHTHISSESYRTQSRTPRPFFYPNGYQF